MTLLVVAVVGMLGGSAIGFVVAWWIRRRTQLTIRHAYIAAVLLGVLLAGAGLANAGALAVAIVPFFFAATFASAVGRNWRLSDLGAGEDLLLEAAQPFPVVIAHGTKVAAGGDPPAFGDDSAIPALSFEQP